MEKNYFISPLQEITHKNPPKLIKNISSNKDKPKKLIQLPLIQKNENIEFSNIPIKTLKLDILHLNEIRSPAKKAETTKKQRNLNQEKLIPQLSSKTIQKVAINLKETQKKIEKKNEEIENALKNLVTVKREALLQRSQIRNSSNRYDNKLLSDQNKKSNNLKKKIPEIIHNRTKNKNNFQETINFKDIFYLEPLDTKLSQRMFRKDLDLFQETLKSDNNKKLAVVNRKFRKILNKIQKNEYPNCFNQVLCSDPKDFHLQKDFSSKSLEIIAKDFNLMMETPKIVKLSKNDKNHKKIHSTSFSFPIELKKTLEAFSCRFFASTQSQISKSVSRESLIDINKKKSNELKRKLTESPFLINFLSEEAISSESQIEVIQGIVFKWKEDVTIGSGANGRVMKAFDIENNRVMAVKKIDILSAFGNDKASISEIEDEMIILKSLHHPNIIELYGFEKIENCLCLYLEFMSLGNISDLLKKQGPFQESLIRRFSKQILSGLKYLHDKRIIHKDIKGANILVNESNIVKLADFGSAQQLERTLTMSLRQGNKAHSIYGSIPWMAPEVIRQTKYGRKADIWSFGCAVLEMAQGKSPWSEQNFDNPIAAIMKIGLSDEIPKIPEDIGENLKDFICCCLKRDANLRPHAKELLNHKFLEDIF